MEKGGLQGQKIELPAEEYETLSIEWKVKVLVTQLCLTLCDPMDYIAHQVPLSMSFSKQEYWSGFPCPPPGDLPNPGIKPAFLTSPALAGRLFITSATNLHLNRVIFKKRRARRESKCSEMKWLILFQNSWETKHLRSKSKSSLKRNSQMDNIIVKQHQRQWKGLKIS